MEALKQSIEKIGSYTLSTLNEVGLCGVQLYQALYWSCCPPYRWKLLVEQMEFIGNKSLLLALLTGSFTGMVFTFQSYETLNKFGSESVVGGIVAVSMFRELGPVLTSLMINARAGSAIAAEIGSMRTTEQIDALTALGINSVQYLFFPRILASLIMTPVLGAIASVTGIFGSYLVGTRLLKIDEGIFFSKIIDFVKPDDIYQGLFKAAIFGLIFSYIGAFKGFNASGGARGVGLATTEAVVVSSVLILFSDYIITVFWVGHP